jgi:hypothetical protein
MADKGRTAIKHSKGSMKKKGTCVDYATNLLVSVEPDGDDEVEGKTRGVISEDGRRGGAVATAKQIRCKINGSTPPRLIGLWSRAFLTLGKLQASFKPGQTPSSAKQNSKWTPASNRSRKSC